MENTEVKLKRADKFLPCKKQPKEGIATLVSADVSLKLITISRDEEVHSAMTKLQIYQEDKLISNLYVFNNTGSKYRKHKLPELEREIGKSTTSKNVSILLAVTTKQAGKETQQRCRRFDYHNSGIC